MEINPNGPKPFNATHPSQTDQQRKVAEEFEVSFLTEMLKHSGLNKTSESFGGGAGEEAFSSMLNDAYAKALVKSGGIGIAEVVYQSIVEKAANSQG